MVRMAPGWEQPESPTLVFAGDFAVSDEATVPDEAVRAILQSSTVVANLEAPVVANGGPIVKAGPHLRMTRADLSGMARLGVNCACLANNHIGDYGPSGVLETIDACAHAGVRTFGAGPCLEAAVQPLSLKVAGHSVALLGGCESETGMATRTHPGVAPLSAWELRNSVVEAAKIHDFVAVYAHGGVEDVPLSPTRRMNQLEAFLEAGADVVIGGHPHCPQGWRETSDGVMFASTGDFYFGRAGVVRSLGQASGFLVAVEISRAGWRNARVLPFVRVGVRLQADVGRVASLERLAAVETSSSRGDVWAAVADGLFEQRYLPFLAEFGSAGQRSVSGPPIVRSARDWAARAKLRHVWSRPTRVAAVTMSNLMRCESHRWTIEDALESSARGGVSSVPAQQTAADLLAEWQSPIVLARLRGKSR